jgi:hypothetical protein
VKAEVVADIGSADYNVIATGSTDLTDLTNFTDLANLTEVILPPQLVHFDAVTAGPAVCKSEVVDGKFLPFPVFEE